MMLLEAEVSTLSILPIVYAIIRLFLSKLLSKLSTILLSLSIDYFIWPARSLICVIPDPKILRCLFYLLCISSSTMSENRLLDPRAESLPPLLEFPPSGRPDSKSKPPPLLYVLLDAGLFFLLCIFVKKT